jgi:hypothetical protein
MTASYWRLLTGKKQWRRIPTHFRKNRRNGWGTQTVLICRINSY